MIPRDQLSLVKGLGPALARAGTPDDLVGSSLFAADREFPQLSLNGPALDANIAAMMAYVRSLGAQLAPHGKTAMSPQLAREQMRAGAWAITAATPAQLRVFRDGGISRLLLANQLVEPSAVEWLRAELDRDADFECVVTVDSLAGLEVLRDRSTADGKREIAVMLEVGHAGGRTGTRSDVELAGLARAAAATPGVRVLGLTAYEGTLPGDSPDEIAAAVTVFATNLAASLGELAAAELLPAEPLVSIGGSAYFDAAFAGLIAGGATAERVILRSGAYLTHDSGLYSRVSPAARGNSAGPRFSPAISVWAPVLSVPEPGFALLLCGRRDVGFDQGLPVVLGARSRSGTDARAFDATVTDLADQHAFIRFDPEAATKIAVGDLVELGISHPCTTLDRWSLVPVIDDDHRIRELIGLYFS